LNYSISLLAAVTIDYVPQALISLKSARNTCSFSSYYIFVADALSINVEEIRVALGEDSSWVKLFGPEELEVEKQKYLQIFNYYNRFEISQLAKYVGVSYVLNNSIDDVCVFVDSDTLFIDDVCPVIEEIEEKAVYLTPHLLEPSTDDNEHEVMIHGWINTGFSAFNRKHEQTQDILEWIIDRISRRAFLAPHLGLSGDQTWVSALPVLFHKAVAISTYDGLNVAYWNIDKRLMKGSLDSGILVNDVPLVMFHFSGFSESNPQFLSKHTGIQLEAGSLLDELCQNYLSEIKSVESLKIDIKGIEAMPCAKGSLQTRIKTCSLEHNINIYKAMVRPGIFNRLGSIADALLRKIYHLFGT
jgi:hypothetical protein